MWGRLLTCRPIVNRPPDGVTAIATQRPADPRVALNVAFMPCALFLLIARWHSRRAPDSMCDLHRGSSFQYTGVDLICPGWPAAPAARRRSQTLRLRHAP